VNWIQLHKRAYDSQWTVEVYVPSPLAEHPNSETTAWVWLTDSVHKVRRGAVNRLDEIVESKLYRHRAPKHKPRK
jgi:hypothetical protein